ncbi:uncharacterized protein LOC120840955 isoform X2 [Ixodes scapularis]|uniref:uncharacterized protein LOC120840955 isoform X2 n=1 Tax=Ixodes scapularis TaxID=6945 RepID=UPI001A9FB67C|nr:uncharacterized protein LOC120840955 isoform X2 [Ixodes scapularis]
MDTKAVRRLHWRRCALKTVKPPKERACQMKLLQMTPLQMYHWPSCSDDDGNTFIFPKLGALHDTIISGKPLTSSSFRKIVELLFRAMVNITVFPSQHFYSKVTQLLTDKYPQLQDVIGTGSLSSECGRRYRPIQHRQSVM